MDKISIITVCFNESQERISYTLDSIVGQSYPSIECVIVDGGSNSETKRAYEQYLNRIDKFISEPDKGIYDAMNKGIKASTGEWLIFMNIGDRFHDSNVLINMINFIKGKTGDLVCGDILRDGRERIFYPNRFLRGYLCYHSICHQAILARKSIFDVIGNFDISFRLVADRDWVFRAIKAGFKYVHTSVVVCDWELGGVCFDYRIEEIELQKYRVEYFFSFERTIYRYLWFAEKVIIRIKTLNFAIPVKLK